MNFDLEKIEEIYGEEYIYLINNYKNDISLNIEYLHSLGFDDVNNIFERVTPIFLLDNKIFKNKIDNLIKKIGVDYVNIIESNLQVLEELE